MTRSSDSRQALQLTGHVVESAIALAARVGSQEFRGFTPGGVSLVLLTEPESHVAEVIPDHTVGRAFMHRTHFL